MEGALAWLSELVQWFGQLFPRWVIVDTRQGWIKWIAGSRVVTGGPGIVWYWPARTGFTTYPVVRQAMTLRPQTITATDNKVWVVAALVVYEIENLETIIAHTYDPDQTIKDISMGAVHDVYAHRPSSEFKARATELELRREIVKRLKPYGVRVIRAGLADLAPVRAYKLMQSTSQDGL